MTPTFETGTPVLSSISLTYSPRWVGQTYTADLDQDGNTDLLVLGATYPGDAGGAVAQPSFVAFGNGSGGFTPATASQFPYASLATVHPREVAFADFNGDGFLDVFIASHGYDAMPFPGEQNQLFLSNGNGTWRNATANLPVVSDFTHSTTVGDVNGDGKLDIFVGNTPQPNVNDPYILINDGAGNFTRDTSLLPTGAGGSLNASVRRLTSSLLTDLDGDGRLDLVAGTAFSTEARPTTVQVLWNQQGSFAQSPATDLPFPAVAGRTQDAYDIQSLDVNFDGRPDLLINYLVASGGWELQVLINQGNRTFVDQTTTYLPDPASRYGAATSPQSQYWIQFLKVADINHDGRLDFTLDSRGTTSAPSWMPVAYIHQADGTFAAATVANLGGVSHQWLFDMTTQYIEWNGGAGFAHLGFVNGNVMQDLLPVTFAQVNPVLSSAITTPQNLFGTAGADAMTGGSANDRFTGAAGNDAFDGMNGIDTAVFSGARANYTITRTATGYTVKDNVGTDGTDTLTHVERLQFSDAKVAIDVDGNGGQAYRLYQAAFNRTPDVGGLGFQMNALDSGWAISAIAQNFMDSPEFLSTYGNLNTQQFVTQLYQNVLHRAPDASGLAFHANNLDSGAIARRDVLVQFSESPENQAAVIGVIQGGMVYTL